MMILLDLHSDVPIYTQLVNQIMEGIASGRLKPGEALPSVRSLAADIGINLHTVNKAYTILKNEGFIQVHRQKGVIIQPSEMPDVSDQYEEKLQDQLKPLVAEAICRGMPPGRLMELVVRLYTKIKRADSV